jgi:acetamidase/formamidase
MASAAHAIRIDRRKPLREEPHTGHNRWHPDIPPILRVDPGDTVSLETRNALDGAITPTTTVADRQRGVTHHSPAGDGRKFRYQAAHRMIDHLVAEHGYSREQAYALTSVAVDLRISELVDVPNLVVSAFLPLDIFG